MASELSTVQARRDPCTVSNYNAWKTTHTKTDLTIDFERRILHGLVSLQLTSVAKSLVDNILLDTSHLDIQDIKANGQESHWELMPRIEPFGSLLTIKLGKDIAHSKTVELDIKVQTTEQCTALGWLTPAQARSKHPYMYSQCQAIHARSIFPCQDTPDVKSTFEFNIKSPLPVIASGLVTGVKDLEEEKGMKLYSFRQDIPIPSYLFALASGDIATAKIGPRSVVATGPDKLEAAKWEFEKDTEHYIQSIEKLVFPYQWGEYNLLVLPQSFPYGGMENPVYTYCTPTVVSGDRENVDLIAHELSHAYSGNLVTNASWEHFYLNEGWTTYLERRLQAAVHGEPHRDFSAIIGWKGLADDVNSFGASHEFTKLVPNLTGKDPDDAFSKVPYEKGYTFLSYLESTVGREKWDKFIPHYFTTFARKSLTTTDFLTNLHTFFSSDPTATSALKTVNWNTWLYAPGLPPKPTFDTSLADVCYLLASKWKSLTTSAEAPTEQRFEPSAEDIRGWRANQVVVFLDEVVDFATGLGAEKVRLMGERYGFGDSGNVEVVARFLGVGLRAREEGCYEPTAAFLGEVGRMKFVRPLYKELGLADHALALETFEKNRAFYHPICRAQVEKDLFGER